MKIIHADRASGKTTHLLDQMAKDPMTYLVVANARQADDVFRLAREKGLGIPPGRFVPAQSVSRWHIPREATLLVDELDLVLNVLLQHHTIGVATYTGDGVIPLPTPKAVEDFSGALTEHGPMVVFPAPGIVCLVAEDNTTIDMAYEQARTLGATMVAIPPVEVKLGHVWEIGDFNHDEELHGTTGRVKWMTRQWIEPDGTTCALYEAAVLNEDGTVDHLREKSDDPIESNHRLRKLIAERR